MSQLLTHRGVLLLWGPRVIFVAGSVFLVVQSARGAPPAAVMTAVVVFLLCAAVLVVRQLALHREADRRGLFEVGGGLAAAGVLVFFAYPLVGADALPIIGAALVALGVGWVVEGMRQWGSDGATGERALLAVMGVAAVVFVIGAALFVALPMVTELAVGSTAELLMVGLAVVSLVVAVNLVSEWALIRVEAFGEGNRSRRQLVGLAVLALVLVAVVVLWSLDWVITAALVLGVALLLVAMVSNTHADVALLLAVVAVLGAAPVEEAAPPTPTDQSRGVLVALGDSYMSGEGAEKYYSGTDDAQGDECRRSPSAYAVVATRTPGSPFGSLVFLACSGARTVNVIAANDAPDARSQYPEEHGTQTSQLKELLAAHPALRPTLVIVSIGGNDAGFGTIAETCLFPGDCSTQRALFEDNLPGVEKALVATYASVRKALHEAGREAPVVAVPYPQPFADRDRCDGVALTKKERDFIRGFVDRLDATVESAARQTGAWYAAALKTALADRHEQLCDATKANAGINFLDVRSVNGLAFQRLNPTRWLHNSLHPNERGHDALAAALTTWLAKNPQALTGAGPGEAQPPTTLSEELRNAVAKPQPPCSMTDPGESNCQTQARRWEMGQVLARWTWFPALFFGLILVWAASIAAISWLPGRGRRSRRPHPSG